MSKPRYDVRVTGLRKLSRALKQIDPELQKAFKGDMKVVAERVASRVRARVPRRSGRAASSVKGGADMKSAYVQGGKKTVPYYGWLEFGGTLRPTGGRRNEIHRPVDRDGRYLWPTVTESRDESLKAAAEAADKAARDAGIN